MNEILRFAVLGLGGGSVYALLALGIVLIHRGSHVVNFSQGALAMTGSYFYVELRDSGASTALAVVTATAILALLGATVYWIVMRPLANATPLTRTIATLGVLIVLQSAASLRYKGAVTTVASFLPQNVYRPGGLIIFEDRIWLLGIAVGLTAVLSIIARYSLLGLATSAVAENRTAAATLGWSPHVIATINWAAGSAIAALAGILIIPLTGLQATNLTLLVLAALAAAMVGNFASFWLALAGGVAIGILQAEVTNYVDTPGAVDAIPFLVVIVVLVWRGQGLPPKGALVNKLPELGTGVVRPLVLVPVLAVTIVTIMLVGVEWADAFVTTFVFGMILLSIVVLTGYAGQLSLGQFALGGVGALVAGRLVAGHSWPFELALLAGIVGAVLVGLIFALPALRTRGVNLAIITLGLGLAVHALIFKNSAYTGGDQGTVVGPPTFLGIDIGALRHPDRYAVFTLLCFVGAAIAVTNVRRSRTGRRLVAVRTNERAAASLGVNVMAAKMYAFALSAAIAGLGGILLGFRANSIVYEQFDPLSSILVVSQAILGGVGYAIGPLFGVQFASGSIGALAGIKIFDSRFSQWLALAGGVFVIVVLVSDPNGMASEFSGRARRWIGRMGDGARRWSMRGTEVEFDTTAPDQPARGRVAPKRLVAQNLTVQFNGVVALDAVDLIVDPCEIVALIGPNGAGKTTCIDALTGFARLSTGAITLDGDDITGWPAHRRARHGLARSFQSLELFEDMTVWENLCTASDERDAWSYATNLIKPGERALTPAAEAAVREFGLERDLNKRPSALPYGKRRLVAIARAVAAEPSVLVLDEPAAGLSEVESRELSMLLRRLATQRGMGILLIEHDMSVVMEICDRLVVLEFGRRIASGPPAEVRADPEVIAAYLGVEASDHLGDHQISVDAT